MISAKQVQLARTMLDLSQQELAERLEWSHQTVSKIEKGSVNPPASRLAELEKFFVNAGVELLDGDGVRKRPEGVVNSYEDHEGFVAFLTDVYETCKQNEQPQVVVNNVAEDDFLFWEKDYAPIHQKRMADIGAKFRIIVQKGDRNFTASEYAEYRWASTETYNSNVSYYIYAHKAAMIDFGKDHVRVVVVESEAFAEFFREEFEKAWEQTEIPAK